MIKRCLVSGKLKPTKTIDNYSQKKDVFIFNKKVNGYHVWIKGYNNDITEMHWTFMEISYIDMFSCTYLSVFCKP